MKRIYSCAIYLLVLFAFSSCSNEKEVLTSNNLTSATISESAKNAIADFINKVEGKAPTTRADEEPSLRKLLPDMSGCEGSGGNCLPEDVIITPGDEEEDGSVESIDIKSAWASSDEAIRLENLVKAGKLTKRIFENSQFTEQIIYIYQSTLDENIKVEIPVRSK